jgi:hypothetical protein
MANDPHRLSLGRRGEAQWQQLSASYRLAPERGRAMIISDSPAIRDEIRRRLMVMSDLRRLNPRSGMLEEVRALVPWAKRVPIAWVEAGTSAADLERWRHALVELNRGRDSIGEVFLVLAGSARAHELLSLQAPDLTHVLDPILVFGDEVARVAHSRER